MAELAPVDNYGMPHAVLPAESPNPNADLTPSEHHAFYTRMAPEFTTDAGSALRASRVHILPRWLHDSYHKRFMAGTDRKPQTEQEAFGLLILSCAGYLSREGWARQPNGSLKLVDMNDDTYLYIRNRQRMHVQTELNSKIPIDGPDPRRTQDNATRQIVAFFTDYAKRQNLDHLKDADFVDEFLNTSNTLRRYELGRLILKEAARVAVEPVSPIYQNALREGLTRVKDPDPVNIITRFSFTGSWAEHIEALEQKLAA